MDENVLCAQDYILASKHDFNIKKIDIWNFFLTMIELTAILEIFVRSGFLKKRIKLYIKNNYIFLMFNG